MTKARMIEALKEYPDDAQIWAYNGDEEKMCPVTGLLFTPPEGSEPAVIEICTDEP